MRKSKYKSKRVTVDGITFHSKAESDRYLQLKALQEAGEIESLELQPSFTITLNDHTICKVMLDFAYKPANKTKLDKAPDGIVYEDVKGVDTSISRLKRKLLAAQYGIPVNIMVKQKGGFFPK